MKATGIVRRLDELGRIVIPKELRRTLHLREGDPMEIYTQDAEEIILKKYSSLGELSVLAGEYCGALARTAAQPVAICNRQQVVACAGFAQQNILHTQVGPAVQRVLQARRIYTAGAGEALPAGEKVFLLPEGEEQPQPALRLAVPIAVAGQTEGCILLVACAPFGERPVPAATETERKLTVLTAELLAKQLQM